MTVNFYKTFSKRKNSTKQPAAADTYDAIDCKLKEDCSIENPSFIISQRTASASGNPVTVNAQRGDMINPVITFNPVQSGSGTPSPSNPRPISGYNSLDITVNGNTTSINLGETFYSGTCDAANGETIENFGYYTATGSETISVYGSGINRFGRFALPSQTGENYSDVLCDKLGSSHTYAEITSNVGSTLR